MFNKINKNRQNPQDTCSKKSGRVFSEVAEAPQAAATRRTVLGDPETAKKMSNMSRRVFLLVCLFYVF